MSRLWVRNLIGIAVVAAAIVTLCVVELYPQWSSYRRTVEPERVIGRDGSSTISGQTWRLGSVHRTGTLPESRYGPSIPKGAVLTVVTIERSGSPVPGRCVGVLTDGRRRWQDQSASGASFPVSRGATEFCSKRGPLQFNFLLPSDATPTALDITDTTDAIQLRIVL